MPSYLQQDGYVFPSCHTPEIFYLDSAAGWIKFEKMATTTVKTLIWDSLHSVQLRYINAVSTICRIMSTTAIL